MSRKTYRKIIVTDDELSNVNPINKNLQEKFLKEKSSRLSSKSIENYKGHLNIFFVWNLQHNGNKEFTSIKKLELSEYFNFVVTELRWGSFRYNGGRSCLSSFSQFIEKFYDEEYPSFRNIVLKTIESVPKEFRREKTVLTDEQINSLLSYLSETNSQAACWLALAIYSGSRFSELLRFEINTIDENNTAFGDLFLETTTTIRTKGRGREGKLIRKYILRDKFLPFYKKWVFEREKILLESGKETTALFLRGNDAPATDGTVRSWVSGMEKFLGINLYPHALRHYLEVHPNKSFINNAGIFFLDIGNGQSWITSNKILLL